MKKILYFSLIFLLLLGLSTGCKKGSVIQDDIRLLDNGNTTGIFKLVITSSSNNPLLQISSGKEDIIGLVVTIKNLEVHRTSDSDAGWISIPILDGTFDLMVLDAAVWEEIISQTELFAGHYNKFRFAVTNALVTTESGIYDAEIPSGVLKINAPFIVHEDGTTEITIRIDPEASLKVTGKNPKYKLIPVLKSVKVVEDNQEDMDNEGEDDKDDDHDDNEDDDSDDD